MTSTLNCWHFQSKNVGNPVHLCNLQVNLTTQWYRRISSVLNIWHSSNMFPWRSTFVAVTSLQSERRHFDWSSAYKFTAFCR